MACIVPGILASFLGDIPQKVPGCAWNIASKIGSIFGTPVPIFRAIFRAWHPLFRASPPAFQAIALRRSRAAPGTLLAILEAFSRTRHRFSKRLLGPGVQCFRAMSAGGLRAFRATMGATLDWVPSNLLPYIGWDKNHWNLSILAPCGAPTVHLSPRMCQNSKFQRQVENKGR